VSDINKPCPLCGSSTAAKRIAELEAEVERLREALEEIVATADRMTFGYGSNVSDPFVWKFRAIAFAALEEIRDSADELAYPLRDIARAALPQEESRG
jgi:hypothetical protein